jgi:hypothetical protein
VKWQCPQGSGYQADEQDTCQCGCLKSLIRVEPQARPRFAISFPWSQLVEIGNELVIGRKAPRFRDRADVAAYTQLGKRHARFFWGSDGELYIEDLKSKNGTYVDGRRVFGVHPAPLRLGCALRLAKNVPIELLEVNEYGEPL